MSLKKWKVTEALTQEELNTLAQAATQELNEGEIGDHVCYVAGDTLIFGTKEEGGPVVLYECLIRRASIDSAPYQRDGSKKNVFVIPEDEKITFTSVPKKGTLPS